MTVAHTVLRCVGRVGADLLLLGRSSPPPSWPGRRFASGRMQGSSHRR